MPDLHRQVWSSFAGRTQNDKAAFCGYERLVVYDLKQKRLLMEEELKHDSISYFGWSPDGSSICTEHPNLACGSIIRFPQAKLSHIYEDNTKLYYKGFLDENHFYGTLRLDVDEQKQKESGGALDEYRTVVTGRNGTVLYELTEGRFRDACGSALLQAGIENFGLFLYPDYKNTGTVTKLTEEFVYDAKFIDGGSAVFITKSGDAENNLFLLSAAGPSGKVIATADVHGSALALSPDGKSGVVSGSRTEKIDFTRFVESGGKEGVETPAGTQAVADTEKEAIYRAVRGAMDVYLKNEILGTADLPCAERYFTDSLGPEQCANSDMKRMFEERKFTHNADYYSIDLLLSGLSVKGGRASVSVNGLCRNSFGSGMGVGSSLELTRKEDRWYVTGFSTFPDSGEYRKVSGMLPGIFHDLENGKLFDGKLKNRKITAGQVQFWQMSDPHLAEDIRNANFCKVYLHVEENGADKLYRLVLDKKNYRKWTPTQLEDKRLSFLF